MSQLHAQPVIGVSSVRAFHASGSTDCPYDGNVLLFAAKTIVTTGV